MANIGFVKIRMALDEAMTYGDLSSAQQCVADGLHMACEEKWLSEEMYFKAQREILEGHHADAIIYLDLAIKHNPCDGAAHNDRALCLIALHRPEEALHYFDKGIECEPDYATIYHNKGWFLSKLGQHEQALILFNKALELEPNRPVTYENMANAYVHLGARQKAVESFRTALQLLGPCYPEIKQQLEQRVSLLQRDKD